MSLFIRVNLLCHYSLGLFIMSLGLSKKDNKVFSKFCPRRNGGIEDLGKSYNLLQKSSWIRRGKGELFCHFVNLIFNSKNFALRKRRQTAPAVSSSFTHDSPLLKLELSLKLQLTKTFWSRAVWRNRYGLQITEIIVAYFQFVVFVPLLISLSGGQLNKEPVYLLLSVPQNFNFFWRCFGKIGKARSPRDKIQNERRDILFNILHICNWFL